ncbi:CAP domain-containing protein [Halomarina halobia]|uniref:CAP domain-containing protein n=1 Tax=Halomarina halobia TaxID=3033386 RepID=A0ABD6AA83_9EURY|nr:CAP domain-containing protein [Halomarina sp. PSR21]
MRRRTFLGALAAGASSLAGCADLDLPPGDPSLPEVPGSPERDGPPPSVPEPTPTAGIDPVALERRVHDEVNDARGARDLGTLDFDTALRRIARYHSADMAKREYFAHESPEGETVEDRYDRFGYDCRAPTGAFEYATGGENLFYVGFAPSSLDEDAIARRAVEGWLESPGHRRNLLAEFWRREGIGVAVAEGVPVTVYVTQNFC